MQSNFTEDYIPSAEELFSQVLARPQWTFIYNQPAMKDFENNEKAPKAPENWDKVWQTLKIEELKNGYYRYTLTLPEELNDQEKLNHFKYFSYLRAMIFKPYWVPLKIAEINDNNLPTGKDDLDREDKEVRQLLTIPLADRARLLYDAIVVELYNDVKAANLTGKLFYNKLYFHKVLEYASFEMIHDKSMCKILKAEAYDALADKIYCYISSASECRDKTVVEGYVCHKTFVVLSSRIKIDDVEVWKHDPMGMTKFEENRLAHYQMDYLQKLAKLFDRSLQFCITNRMVEKPFLYSRTKLIALTALGESFQKDIKPLDQYNVCSFFEKAPIHMRNANPKINNHKRALVLQFLKMTLRRKCQSDKLLCCSLTGEDGITIHTEKRGGEGRVLSSETIGLTKNDANKIYRILRKEFSLPSEHHNFYLEERLAGRVTRESWKYQNGYLVYIQPDSWKEYLIKNERIRCLVYKPIIHSLIIDLVKETIPELQSINFIGHDDPNHDYKTIVIRPTQGGLTWPQTATLKKALLNIDINGKDCGFISEAERLNPTVKDGSNLYGLQIKWAYWSYVAENEPTVTVETTNTLIT